MKLKHVIISYVLVWLVLIFFVCLFEWRALSRFQLSYDEEILRQGIKYEMKAAGNESEAMQIEDKTEAVLNEYEIIVDDTMSIFVNGVRYNPENRHDIKNKLYKDYYELTGNKIQPFKCVIKTADISDIKVTDHSGNEISQTDNNYLESLYVSDEQLFRIVLDKFECYLNYLNGVIDKDGVMTAVRSGSKAHSALINSQSALEWTVKSTSVVFENETVTKMRMLDDTHIICNIEIDLTKNTVKGKVENEHVNYQVLFENVSGEWYIYSFLTK